MIKRRSENYFVEGAAILLEITFDRILLDFWLQKFIGELKELKIGLN
jgi:hypothetical protein